MAGRRAFLVCWNITSLVILHCTDSVKRISIIDASVSVNSFENPHSACSYTSCAFLLCWNISPLVISHGTCSLCIKRWDSASANYGWSMCVQMSLVCWKYHPLLFRTVRKMEPAGNFLHIQVTKTFENLPCACEHFWAIMFHVYCSCLHTFQTWRLHIHVVLYILVALLSYGIM